MRLRMGNKLSNEKVGDSVKMSSRLRVREGRKSKEKQRYGLQQRGDRITGCVGMKKEHCMRNNVVGMSVT